MKKNFKNNKKQIKIPKYKYFIANIISAFAISLPWVSYLKITNLTGAVAQIFPNRNGIFIDFFLYYKGIFIIIFGAFLLLFFLGERIFPDYKINDYPLKERSNRLIIGCVFIYILMVIISSMFSKYKEIVMLGSPTEGEGTLVLIAYMILFLAGLNYFCYEKSIKVLNKSLILFMTIIVILALIEFLYKPMFEIGFFQRFLGPDKYRELISSIKNKDYNGMISLTMYNPNYFGGLCILLFPISFTTLMNVKNKLQRAYLSLLSIGMIFSTIAAKSTASTYIVLFEILFLLIIYRRELIKRYKFTIIYLVTLIIVFISINIVSENKLLEISISALINKPSIINEKEKFILKDIDLDGESLYVKGNNDSLIISVSGIDNINTSDFKFYNKDKEEILPLIENDKITFNNEEFKAITVKNLKYGIVVDIGYNDTMEFYITENGFKGVGQNGAVIDKIKRDEIVFPKLYDFATGRGYTWVNTLPILRRSILLGQGPGTFAMNFQQNDYVGLMNTHGSAKFVIDKPHNMYFQVATQTGILSLVALVIIFIISILKSINFYFKHGGENKNSYYTEFSLGLGIFIGILGFLILGLVNDSIVTVNPIFWILLGINFSILNILKPKLNTK